MAAALTGCVIVSQDTKSRRMKYKKKCEFCGWLEVSSTSTGIPAPGAKMAGSFPCPKCRQKNKFIIQG